MSEHVHFLSAYRYGLAVHGSGNFVLMRIDWYTWICKVV